MLLGLDQDSTSCSLLHSVTVSGIGTTGTGTGDSVREGVTDSSAVSVLSSAVRAVEEFIVVFESFTFNTEDDWVCESVCCSDVLISFFSDLLRLLFFFPLSELVPFFFSSPSLVDDNESEGGCAMDEWETLSLSDEVTAIKESACFSSALLSRLLHWIVL